MHAVRTPPARAGRLPLLFGAAAVVAAALVALVLLRGDGSQPVSELDLIDLPTQEMIREIGLALDRPSVMELPPLWSTDTHDLHLKNTTLLRVLREIEKLDPRYEAELRGDVLLYWAGPELVPQSPYARTLERFQADGGAATVVRELVVQAELDRTLSVQADPQGQSRPITLDLTDCTVRDVLVEIARQGHLAMRNDPSMIRLVALPE